jgi:NAD(P)-dependent dehydrogenase (short-subunit alcohol dehydrogenase family)
VAIVTGAGGGIGRGHAYELARHGAVVLVNDRGVDLDGRGGSSGPAEAVAAETPRRGGTAISNTDDIADWEGAGRLVGTAIAEFGRLDVLVNNAGIIRDRMLVKMSEEDWDAVVRVHLKGTFCPTRHAAAHWRERSKSGDTVAGRVINTTSAAGLYGNVGQTNYGSAKAAIAAFSIIAAAELERYGVTVNAIGPGGRTRMTANMIQPHAGGADAFDPMDPANAAPLVAWLASAESSGVTGRVFELLGGRISVAEGWRQGPRAERPGRWDALELGPVIADLIARTQPPTPFLGV